MTRTVRPTVIRRLTGSITLTLALTLGLALSLASALGACDEGAALGTASSTSGDDAALPGDDAALPGDDPALSDPSLTDPALSDPATSRPPHHIFLASGVRFAEETSTGVTNGFDLDGLVTKAGNTAGCGVADFTSPAGTPGIDNQTATFIPILEELGVNQVQDYLQGAVLEGGILMVFVIDGLDDPVTDDDVTLTMLRGAGKPLLDAAYRVEPWQTIGIASEEATEGPAAGGSPVLGVSTHAYVAEGYVHGFFDDLRLPALLFDVFVDFDLKLGQIRIPVGVTPAHSRAVETMSEPERMGYAAGAVELQSLIDVAARTPSQGFDDMLRNLGPFISDLDPDGDGECRHLSATLEVEIVPAWLMDADIERVLSR